MSSKRLQIKGAKTHNLKNINLEVPKNKLVVFTGVSGSGKSSLVFDTIYSEGQRRYVESLSSYARQFLGVMDKPDVDSIEGISPAIAIDQKSVSKNPRSTVGTITEIYDYLRLLFAHYGIPYCPNCNVLIESSSASEIANQIEKMRGEIMVLAPLVSSRKGEHRALLEEVAEAGFMRVRMNGNIVNMDEALNIELDPHKKHTIEVLVDTLEIEIKEDIDRIRIVDSIETALKLGKGILLTLIGDKEKVFSEKFACHKCGFSMREIEPRTFSFNSPYGACEACSGLGTQMEVDPNLVIPNKKLSLAEGAIKPWMSASHRVGRQGWYWVTLQRMAEKYGFSMDTPVGKLSEADLQIILNGDDEIDGVIPNLQRRYKETDSEWTRAEIEKYMNIKECPVCEGARLKPEALAVKVAGESIYDITEKSISDAQEFFDEIFKKEKRSKSEESIARPVVKEIKDRLSFLDKVGLSYLTLGRRAGTLSGGEAQRIRLATQLGARLSGVFYILDEPSIGLHARDQQRLIGTMKDLRDLGNSVLVVEHDDLTIKDSDMVVEIGPGAGKNGGKIMFKGTPAQLKNKKGVLTGDYLSGRKVVDGELEEKDKKTNTQSNTKKKSSQQKKVSLKGVKHNNLKNVNVDIPLGKLVCVSGVSGSGKSSLVNDVLAKVVMREFHKAQTIPGEHKDIKGLGNLDKGIVIDQAPIGRTPRSNPATYTGLFAPIRYLFSKTQEARSRGYGPGRFSFNVKGGRCEKCRGGGVNKVEMFFLPDVYVECEACMGKRYNKEVLDVAYKGKSIADVLDMTVDEAAKFFKNIPVIKEKLYTLQDVGLGYVQLGQPAPSLSGGEAQRVKLATELSRKATGKTLYILDEPTTGLHFDDINRLIYVLRNLVDAGNSVVVIEHNMDVIKNSDWLIDLGPEGGDEGGEIVAEGTPKQVARIKKSYTGKYLK